MVCGSARFTSASNGDVPRFRSNFSCRTSGYGLMATSSVLPRFCSRRHIDDQENGKSVTIFSGEIKGILENQRGNLGPPSRTWTKIPTPPSDDVYSAPSSYHYRADPRLHILTRDKRQGTRKAWRCSQTRWSLFVTSVYIKLAHLARGASG